MSVNQTLDACRGSNRGQEVIFFFQLTPEEFRRGYFTNLPTENIRTRLLRGFAFVYVHALFVLQNQDQVIGIVAVGPLARAGGLAEGTIAPPGIGDHSPFPAANPAMSRNRPNLVAGQAGGNRVREAGPGQISHWKEAGNAGGAFQEWLS